MKRSLALSLLLVCLAATGAAHAGAAYVPLPGVSQIGSFSYEAQVSVSNTVAPTGNLNQLLLATDTDGTQRPGATSPLQVAGHRTSLLKPGAAFRGLLELAGPPALRYSARLVGTGQAAALGVPLPVVTSDNLAAAGKVVTLQGLTGNASRSSHLTLVNLAKSAAQCTVSLVRADGSGFGAATTVALKPLSHRYLPEILGAAAGVTEVRAAVSCTREFYTYALVTDSATGEIAAVLPAGTGESALQVPGAPEECPVGATCIEAKGVVHRPTAAAPVGRLGFNAPAGTYRRLRLTMNVTPGAWYAKDPDGKHLVYWFVINKNVDMPGMLYFRGPDAYTAMARHGIGLKHPEKIKIVKPFQAVPGRTYRVDNDYDMGRGVYTITVTDVATGEVGVRLEGNPNVAQVTLKTGDRFLLDMGFVEGLTPDEVPTYNWTYSDVRIEAYK